MPSQTKPSLSLNSLIKKIVRMLCLLVCISPIYAQQSWQVLRPGIEYMQVTTGPFSWSRIHAFKLALQKVKLESILAEQFSKNAAFASDFARHNQGSLIAINGGFFDTMHRPLGLRISQNKQQSPLKPISWWGVFYIENQEAHVIRTDAFTHKSPIEFAIQGGPRLLVGGKIIKLKPGLDERTALGITKNGEVLIIITDNAPMTTSSLAKRLKREPFFCKDALNLDGGSSTQVHAAIDNFHLDKHGFSAVADAITVKMR